eukprot:gene6682-6401_t
MSEDPEQFITRAFSRDVRAFEAGLVHGKLSVSNQELFLQGPYDPAITADTYNQLSPSARKAFDATLRQLLSGEVLADRDLYQ